MSEILNFIGGEWRPSRNGATLDVYDPALGSVYAKAPSSGPDDVDDAVKAAQRAFPAWSKTPASERARILREISRAIERELPMLARAECVDSGKPLSLATALDIPRAAQNFSFFADALDSFLEEHWEDGQSTNRTHHDPIGVVACISPWNLPLYLLTWKVAPALAAGCCVVAKPSEVTPMTAHLLTRICRDAGLPPGVLNLIHGTGAGAGGALVKHPGIRAVSFTGSTRTGAEIARLAAPEFKKISLEMGGKNATIVFSDRARDSDTFEKTVAGVLRAAFANQGQVCLCGSRIFIERGIYERFTEALVARARKLRQGDPLDPPTEQGAVVSKEHYEKVLSYIELARKEGGKIRMGGAPAKIDGRCSKGWFIEPTLIEGLDPSCRVNQEEIFGPVATLIPFDTEDEVIAAANSTRYGLSANIWSADIARAERVASKMEAGVIWVNCWLVRDLRTPFGGMKDSGLGREGGSHSLEFFTEVKNICVKAGG